jgi:hypothetical protein
MNIGNKPDEPEYFVCCGRRRLANVFRCPKHGKADVDTQLTYETNPAMGGDTDHLGGALGRVIRLKPGHIALIKGIRGAGKSSIALTAFHGVSFPWLISAEMDPEQVEDYVARLGVKLGGTSVPGMRRAHQIPGQLVDPYDVPKAAKETEFAYSFGLPVFGFFPDLVADSLSAMGDPVEALAMLRRHCAETGARAVVTTQLTVEGTARGGASIEHDVDVVVSIVRMPGGMRRLDVEKNRGGNETSLIFKLGRKGIEIPTWTKAYSIEGRGPDFKIVPFPTRKTEFSAYLKAVAKGEEDEAPKPPFAVSAEDGGSLYTTRWVEPEDGDERREFALKHGLPYYEPSSGKLYPALHVQPEESP